MITLIGTVGGHASPYTANDILNLFNTQQTQLSHGATFTGKPSTQIYSDTNHVLKIRGEIRLDYVSSQRWAKQILEKEQTYRIHHPNKTWFVYNNQENNTILIGNICPRLQPLHDLFTQSSFEPHDGITYLDKVFQHYFRLAYENKIRLDEGLSNFGITPQDDLYYLDDDTYMWDKFISCSHALGVYFRAQPWLTPLLAKLFGQTVRQSILQYFQDSQYIIVLREQLNNIFISNDTQQAIIDHFIEGLTHQTSEQNKPIRFKKTRFLALLADVHANLPALETVLDFLKMHNIEEGVIAGDIVGYGPHPSQCIERVQELDFKIVKGNHDHALGTGNIKKGLSMTAKWALEWSLDKVTQEQQKWLEDLPPILHGDNWLMVHGAPMDPTFFNAYVYEMTYHDNLKDLQSKGIPLCFHGHTHQPGIYARRGIIDKFYYDDEVDLTGFHHVLICPGSIGQPRNGKRGAQFAIYDQEEHKIYYHTLLYDLEKITEEMKQEGFPSGLMNLLAGTL